MENGVREDGVGKAGQAGGTHQGRLRANFQGQMVTIKYVRTSSQTKRYVTMRYCVFFLPACPTGDDNYTPIWVI